MIRSEPRLHLTGAAGTGTTTLGRHLAQRLGLPHLDTDDYYWLPTDPPYTSKRPATERIEMMRAARGTGGWVISGSLVSWGDRVIEGAHLVVFMSLGTATRLARLRRRERARFGDRIRTGGDMARNHATFLHWAAGYEDTKFAGRSRAGQEAWIAGLDVPVLRLVSDRPVEALGEEVTAALPAPLPDRGGR